MDRNDFLKQLEENGISPTIVSFDSSIHEGYNIRKNRVWWEIFLRERGREYNCMGFPSESDALQYMLEILVKLYGNKE